MSSGFNSEALRTIGADLDLRGIKTFAIRCLPDRFVVDAGYQSPPAATVITLHYTRDDIEQLELTARAQSDYRSAVRSFIYLSEILSSVATYTGDKGLSLLGLSNSGSTATQPVIEIECETSQRDRVFERLSGPAIYDLCVRDHKRRGRRRDLNDHRLTRFSSMPQRA